MRLSLVFSALVATTFAQSTTTVSTPAVSTTTVSAPVSSATSACDAVYNACIQEAVNAGQSPNFSLCSSRQAACEGSISATATATPTSSAPPAASTTSACDAVYNACLQEAINAGQSPNFATCNARRAGCEGTVSATPAAYPTAATTYSACDQVYNACIQEAVNKGESPNFSTCNARRAGCEGSAASYPTPAVYPVGNTTYEAVKPYPTVKTEVVTSFTTVCPEPTTLTYNSKTYVVTASTTLTITDCPCTLTSTAIYTPAPKPSAPAAPGACDKVYNDCIAESTNAGKSPNFSVCASRQASCESGASPSAPPAAGTPVPLPSPSTLVSVQQSTPTPSNPTQFTGAANAVSPAGLMGLAVAGVVAFFL